MNYKHIKFSDSEIMRSFEEIAINKKMVKFSWIKESSDFDLSKYNKQDYLDQVNKYKNLPSSQRGAGIQIAESSGIDQKKLLPDATITPNLSKYINEQGYVSVLLSKNTISDCYQTFQERKNILTNNLSEYQNESVKDLIERSYIFAFKRARDILLQGWGLNPKEPLPFYRFSAPAFPSEFDEVKLEQISSKSKKQDSKIKTPAPKQENISSKKSQIGNVKGNIEEDQDAEQIKQKIRLVLNKALSSGVENLSSDEMQMLIKYMSMSEIVAKEIDGDDS